MMRLTGAKLARFKEDQLAGKTADARRTAEQEWADTKFPETFPAFQRIEADEAGRIWVQDYAVSPDIALTWTVYDPTGKMLGAVSTPAGFAVLDFGSDYLLGRWRDGVGVVYIRLYSVTGLK